MPNQHKTRLLGWHPSSPDDVEWVRDEAKRTSTPLRVLLDEALALLRASRHGGSQSRQVATTSTHAVNCKCPVCKPSGGKR